MLRHGEVAFQDQYGARDVWVFPHEGLFLMHYDAAGDQGWRAALATSHDGIQWQKQGPILDLGGPAESDSASASYGTTYFDGERWHMFYLGTPNATNDVLKTPSFPYATLKAWARKPTGPWIKQREVKPIATSPGTWYSHTASPGQIVATSSGYVMLFSAATVSDDGQILRTLGVARTDSLDAPWTVDAEPMLPLTEQVENASLYYEPVNDTWFLFTNHIARDPDQLPIPPQLSNEYTDAVWVYWAPDPTEFVTEQRAVVVDARSSGWSPTVIGLPSVLVIGRRLALYYDGATGATIGHGGRDVAVTWLDLPLSPPLG